LNIIYAGVIGSGKCSSRGEELAFEVGKELALRGAVLVCGGLGGIMEWACHGCREAGGISLGILPGLNRAEANPHVSFALATGLGEMRNFLVVRCSDVLIAIEGEYGTISEVAIALKEGKRVVALEPGFQVEGVELAHSPVDAVERALRCL